MPTPRPPSLSTSPVGDTDGDRYVSVAETPSPPRSGNHWADPEPVQPQSMDRLSSRSAPGGGGLNDLPGSGLHMPPEVLGQAESPSRQDSRASSNDRQKTTLANLNVRARKRSQLAVKATQSQAAAAAAAQFAAIPTENSSMFTLLTFGGVEVIFCHSGSSIIGVCSRTHMVFQTLHCTSEAPAISISSNSSSGLLVVAHEDGIVQTYLPVPTNRGEPESVGTSNDEPMMPRKPPPFPFGRYQWINSLTIDAAKVFYQPGETPNFLDRRKAKPGQLVDISSSADQTLLVAHKNQLAAWEAVQADTGDGPTSPRAAGGKLLWTTLLPSDIVAAKISGDGQAIVVVLDGDEDDDGSFGARTFIHDLEDGSNSTNPIGRSTSVGMVFKPGPFLKHAAPVTRISFRGLGRETSCNGGDGQGNDLLLTFCDSDSAVRIFNQNCWKQLMLWAAPPNSRADWIRGSSAFSLGDLESEKKSKSSRAPSRRPSGASAAEVAGSVNPGLRNAVGSGHPTSAAGAWIAEITFRGAFPALRLSRLSYMKRGNDDSQPAHFESVAAILPAGSIVAGSVLNSDDMGLAIQGIWPAWNPWLSEPTGRGKQNSDTLSGSAMQFLGLSSVPPPHSQFFGDSYLGGTHSPPTELRIAASHPTTGNLVLMEFPLWGDDDFGAMELGSPLRNVLSLSSIFSGDGDDKEKLPRASIDYDSSRLCAQIDPGERSISLLWRKQGSGSLYSSHFMKEDSVVPKSILESAEPAVPQCMEDRSVIPVPLALPSLRLPSGTSSVNRESIVCIKWWPDDSFDGPPLLLALTKSATLMVFEIPPPRYVCEPAMPNFDPFNVSSHGSVDEFYDSGSDEGEEALRQEYEVSVTPHPDFGLGLRLESPMDGLPAIAGSFKRHPLNGGMLPAEKTGMIVLADEVLSVNRVSLEHMTFDDIISTVRHVGAEAGPGEPLLLRFRPAAPERARRNSAVLHESFKPVENVPSVESDAATANRRSIMGVSPKGHRKRGHRRKHSDGGSLASMLVGSFGEAQQEFGRVIAVIRKAITSVEGEDLTHRFLVAPWGKGVGSPSPTMARGAALIVFGEGTKIFVTRLELPLEADPEKAQLVRLGHVDLSEELSGVIRSVKSVPFASEDRCFVVADSQGQVAMMFLNITEGSARMTEAPQLQTSFRQYKIFNLGEDCSQFCIRSSSVGLFATYRRVQDCGSRSTVSVWTARSDPSCRLMKSESAIKDKFFGEDYIQEEIEVVSSDSSGVTVTDMLLLQTGYLDFFPSLVVFTQFEVVVYQRRAGSRRWAPIVRISFPGIPSSRVSTIHRSPLTEKPEDMIPHILPMIQSTLPSFDESSFMLSDWHPESLLAHLCTDDRGAKVAMKEQVQKVIVMLSELVENSSYENVLSTQAPLLVAPFKSIGGPALLESNTAEDSGSVVESAASLFNGRSDKVPEENEILSKIDHLLTALGQPTNFSPRIASAGKSQEFKLAISHQVKHGGEDNDKRLPPLLASFPPAELRVLWVIANIVKNTPKYGKMDKQGQLALTVFTIHMSLKKSPSDSVPKANPSSPYHKSNFSSFFQRRKSSSSLDEKSKLPPQSASSGSVSALMSNYQGHLTECIREPGKKLDWAAVRELRMPFWIRSDDKLRQISEEVGQSLYRESRDILKAAVYFIVAGKTRTLRNLAAADSTESGKKFFKFLTSFDFSSDRGRSAAEKNAFSLLRKNKYDCAAAFFLLAEPPILKSAVETIASKMEDLDLAFMVQRLVGNAQSKSVGQGALGLGGAAMGFGGMLGGGGGYAGTSSVYESEAQRDEELFDDWKPNLNQGAKDLILHRALSNAYEDFAFSALLRLWLGRQEEAWHWLTGFIECPNGIFPEFCVDSSPARIHEVTALAKKSQDPTVVMVNSFINFASGPTLLKAMKASIRTRVASTMLVSSSLCRLGIELPALRSLAQTAETDLFERHCEGALEPTPKAKPSAKLIITTASSIFDTFEPAPAIKSPSTGTQIGQASSSIFDDFDAPPRKNVQSSDGEMASSIFDSFGAPPPAPPKPKPAPHNGEMASSIFDSFDAPPPKAKTPAVSSGGEMQSSIFDSFDAPPPPKQTSSTTDTSTDAMQSSIFDTFDVPAAAPTKKVQDPPPQVVTSKPEDPPEPSRALPKLWREWRNQLFVTCAARRVLRELGSLGARFHIDAFKPAMAPSGKWNSSFIPSSASQVLQFHADGDELLHEVKACLQMISDASGIDVKLIADEALRILEAPYQYYRICFAVLLHLALEQLDLAEDVVRGAAQSIVMKCRAFSFSNDDPHFSSQSMAHLSTLSERQTAAHLSWQLELCLWIHRGGALPLSSLALNETICAVRIGMLLASWNRDFEVLETMIRQPPDCLLDENAGRQLWTSLKLISNSVSGEKKASGTTSGGWEFLVDCRRAEATEMLRARATGCFIIRPHPEDHGVFTLSFKTNLKPSENAEDQESQDAKNEGGQDQTKPSSTKSIKRDDVVQHAIVRLSDSGFRCGSFGPFATLMKLLEAVSSSLPFKLRFDLPPTEGVIKEEGSKPSPNSAFFRKLGLAEGKRLAPQLVMEPVAEAAKGLYKSEAYDQVAEGVEAVASSRELVIDEETTAKQFSVRRKRFGLFLQLLILSEVRKQLSGVAAAKYENSGCTEDNDVDSVGSATGENEERGPEQEYAVAARILGPFLTWCRMMELIVVGELAPHLEGVSSSKTSLPVSLNASETAIEIATTGASVASSDGGDAVIRKMIQPGSGVEFRTLRLGEGGDSAMIVLFSKSEAVDWFLNNGVEKSEEDAVQRLDRMEKSRVIEPVDIKLLAPKGSKKSKQGLVEENDINEAENGIKGIRYRLVDPWEVEPLESREAETRGASLGRHRFLGFGLGRVAASCEDIFRSLGGLHLLELWATTGGGVSLTKAIATVHPPWERGSGGDLQLKNGNVAEPLPYDNSIRQHLYRNDLFRRIGLPQRFMALIQVELLDLKNLTSPGGSLSLTVYSLLRLKRPRSTAPLTMKARTLDSVATHPAKLGKTTGPNAPASWGSLVRFRFPLPEYTSSDGRSYDGNREALFKGPPSVLQVSVYEKKFMSDSLLGGADVKLDGLNSGGQLEEWVPLRTETHGINWFARIRLTLRFELMCISPENERMQGLDELSPSVGLRRIQQLSDMGGVQEDIQKSASTPDILSYFESMVS
jgi:hypothetical protein